MEQLIEIVENYRIIINRIAWRLQYRVRINRKNEFPIDPINNLKCPNQNSNIFNQSISFIYLSDLISQIPSKKGQYVIKRIYLDDLTEVDISAELKISQQAVSKLKKKSLNYLSKIISNENNIPSSLEGKIE